MNRPLVDASLALVLGLMFIALASCSTAVSNKSGAMPDLSTGVSQAAVLSSVCTGCHTSGGSAKALVSLQDYSANLLQRKLLEYKNEADGATVMHRIARGYSEQQIVLIADYVSAQNQIQSAGK